MTDTARNRGTLGIGEDGTFRIRFERTLPHTPERVWAWLTEAELLERWLPGCRIDGRAGGAVHFDFGEEGMATGKVIEAQAPGAEGRLVHTWVWEGVPESTVTWTLTPVDGGTSLTLVHSETQAEPAVDFAVGWHVMLDALAQLMDGGSADEAWASLEQVAALYA